MAKQEIDPNQTVNISAQDLLAIILKLQQDNNKAQAEGSKVLAETLAESLGVALAKHDGRYESPEQKENIAKIKAQTREIQIKKLKNKRVAEMQCPHEVGQKGNKRTGESAFAFWKAPTGEFIGICSYCQKEVSSANPAHYKYFQRGASGSPAESGQFMLANPIEAQLARLSKDDRERVEKNRAEFKQTTPDLAEFD